MRLPFILLFAGTTWMMYRLTARLFGERAGAIAALILNVSPVLSLSTGSWVLPDGPLMFWMLASALCLERVLLPRQRNAARAASAHPLVDTRWRVRGTRDALQVSRSVSSGGNRTVPAHERARATLAAPPGAVSRSDCRRSGVLSRSTLERAASMGFVSLSGRARRESRTPFGISRREHRRAARATSCRGSASRSRGCWVAS